MGNAESQHPGQTPGQAGTGEMRQCYYEVLEVDRSDSTTADDIKKAYRRLALRYHPDKNHENTKEAAEKFIQIQAAYEVLSDEQERAWYDSHREQILRGHDGDTVGSDSAVVGTTVADLMKFFDPSTYARMNDSPKGFYTIMRTLFATLDREEEAAARESSEDYLPYPSFGDSKSDPKTEVRKFYSAWMGFSTVKSFSWRDQWRYSEAPDRRVKRAMEKDNKRHRDAGRREFNDTVKSLVMFIRKRDPRYIKETVDEAKLQATLLAASQSQAAKAKAEFQENLKSFQTQEWMQAEPTPEIEAEYDEESEIEEEFECVACKKVYKNEKQFDAHLKGKKHIKAVKELRKMMREEDFVLGVSDGVSTAGTATPNLKHNGEVHVDAEKDLENQEDLEYLDEHVDEEVLVQSGEIPNLPTSPNPIVVNDEEDSPPEKLQETRDKEAPSHPAAKEKDSDASDSEASLEKELDALFLGANKDRPHPHDTKPKIGAAKAKRQKRAEKVAALEAEGKAPPKRKQRKPYDPVAALQKARGETVTTGKKGKKK